MQRLTVLVDMGLEMGLEKGLGKGIGIGLVAIALAGSLAGCHDDKPAPPKPTLTADTTPVDLSKLKTAIPQAAPDTFTPPKPAPVEDVPPAYPPAPPALMASVNREQAFSRFCFEEFGQKIDPSLRGGVAMLVTVSGQGVSDARVARSRWSSKSGDAVNGCLNEKAKLAWKLEPGEVKSGEYVVQMSFRGT
jgi:hypothetical protein